MNLPLNSVILIYSVGFVCYHFLYYLIIGYGLKRYNYALALLLLHFLFVTDTFYWVQSEFPQGLSLFVLLLACCSYVSTARPAKGIVMGIIAIGCAVAAAFMHPLMVFPIVFAVLFFLFPVEAPTISRKTALGMAVVLLAAYTFKSIYFKNPYDSSSINAGFNSLSLSNMLGNYQNGHFLENCLIKYYWILIFALAIIAFYSAKRQWARLGMFIGFVLGYVLMVNTTHPDASTDDFYMENLYLPITLFILLPVVFHILPTIYSKGFATIVLLLIIVTGTVRIYDRHKTYTARLTWERGFLRENLDKKLMIASDKIPRQLLQMVWGSPYEFWLLSTIENGRTASILISDHIHDYTQYAGLKTTFATTWSPVPYATLPKRYFRFTDTVSVYTLY